MAPLTGLPEGFVAGEKYSKSLMIGSGEHEPDVN